MEHELQHAEKNNVHFSYLRHHISASYL